MTRAPGLCPAATAPCVLQEVLVLSKRKWELASQAPAGLVNSAANGQDATTTLANTAAWNASAFPPTPKPPAKRRRSVASRTDGPTVADGRPAKKPAQRTSGSSRQGGAGARLVRVRLQVKPTGRVMVRLLLPRPPAPRPKPGASSQKPSSVPPPPPPPISTRVVCGISAVDSPTGGLLGTNLLTPTNRTGVHS